MRIAHFVGAFEHYSSVRTDVLAIARQLTKLGHEVEIHTTYLQRGPLSDLDDSSNFRVKYYRPILAIKKYRISYDMVIHILQEFEADLIHAHGYRSFETLCAVLAKLERKRPLIVSTYGSVPYVFKFSERVLKMIQDAVIRHYPLKIADAILAETMFEKNFLASIGIDTRKIYVTYEKVDTNKFVPPKFPSFSTKKILCVSRVTRLKGIHMLLKAYSFLDPALKRDSEVIVVGPIEDHVYYRELLDLASRLNIRDKLRFIGALTFEKMPHIYSSAYLLVLPSLYENIGGVIIEAAACGCPTIASRVGGIPEIIEDGKTGFLFDPGDWKDLADKLSILLSSESLRNCMAREARRLAETKYSIEAYFERVYSAYRRVLGM